MGSSISYHSDTATRATEEQNGWCKPYAIRSKPSKSKLRRTQESQSKSTVLLGYHDTQHGNTHDSTNDKTRQQQHTRRFDTCLTQTQSYSLERPDDQEHSSTHGNQHVSKVFGSGVTAQQMNAEWQGSKPCIETQSGKTTFGHHSLEHHDLGSVETESSHARKTTENSQWP